MNGLLQFAVSNAAIAAAAAVIVVGVTRVWRNPHLAHLLWALVLVKLVTPSLVNVAIPVFRASPLPHESVSPAVDVAEAASDEGSTASGEDSTTTGAETHLATTEDRREPIEAGVPMATTFSADRGGGLRLARSVALRLGDRQRDLGGTICCARAPVQSASGARCRWRPKRGSARSPLWRHGWICARGPACGWPKGQSRRCCGESAGRWRL